jgi:hypothetical protein
VKLNVTTAYTGGSLSFLATQFSNGQYEKLSDYSLLSDFGATINMQAAGLRTITGASSATGTQTGDTLPDFTATGDIWLYTKFNSGPIFSANVTNGQTPTITVEYITDQGIPIPLVMPLRFHA